jgi:hypothetical protein
MKIKNIKSWIIFFSAFFHVLLIYSFPPDTGGGSIAFMLTVPFIFVLSLTLALIFHFKIEPSQRKLLRKSYFYLSIIAIILIGYYSFPCSNDNSTNDHSTPCPCTFIQTAIDLKENEGKIEFSDVFREDGNIYVSMLKQTAALKKYKDRLPDLPTEIYEIYNSANKKSYVIYFKDGKVFSTNSELIISADQNSKIIYKEIIEDDTISFKSSTNGFYKKDDNYEFNIYTHDFKKKTKWGIIDFSPKKINRYREYLIFDFVYYLI